MSAIARDYRERLLVSSADLGLTKGLVLSHLVGFALFCEFALNFIKVEVPFTPVLSVPIRIIALWLVLDRTWRLGPVRLSFWDWSFIGFMLLSSVGAMVNSLDPSLIVGFEGQRNMIGLIINVYLYFLVIREACNRKGFRPDIMLAWFYVAMCWSAVLAILQANEVGGIRDWSLKLYSPQSRETFADKGYGTAAHFNGLAFEMLVATGVAFNPVFRRRPKWWEWLMGLLFLAAFISTESRGGMISFIAAGYATVLFFAYNGARKTALAIVTMVTLAILIWGFIVFALKIERFTRVIEGEKVRSSAYLGTFRYRLDRGQELIKLGLKQPIFGVGRTNIALGSSERLAFQSASAVGGTLDMMYPRMFAEFGIVGIAFLASLILYLLGFIRKSVSSRPFAYSAFICGVIFFVHGFAEYLIFSRGMMMIGVVAALASSPWLVSEKGRLLIRKVRGLDTPDAPTAVPA